MTARMAMATMGTTTPMATLAFESRPLLLSLPAIPFGVAVEVDEVVVPLAGVLVADRVRVTTTCSVEGALPETVVVSSVVVDDVGGGVVDVGGAVVDSLLLLVVDSGVVEVDDELEVDDDDELDVDEGGSVEVGGSVDDDEVGGGGGVVLLDGGSDGGVVEDGGLSGVDDEGVDEGGGGGAVDDGGGSGVELGGGDGVEEGGAAASECSGGDEFCGGLDVLVDMVTAPVWTVVNLDRLVFSSTFQRQSEERARGTNQPIRMMKGASASRKNRLIL